MKKRTGFFKAFPPPAYLSMPAVGLDISDLSIKFAELKYHKGALRLERYGYQAIPAGAIENGEVKKSRPVIEALKKLREKHGLYRVVISLPEEQAYVVRMSLPLVSNKELRQSIELQLEEYVPLSGNNIVFDYQVIRRVPGDKGRVDVSVSVLPAELVKNYYYVLEKAGWQPLAFEIEAHSLARSLLGPDTEGVSLIVGIGKTRTSFAVVEGTKVSFTSTVDSVGGMYVTENIAQKLNISFEEAEKLKIAKGLLRSSDNADVFEVIIASASVLRDEIGNILKYWRSHQPLDSQAVSQIILCNGESTLLGLDNYLASNISLPVKIGDPWRNTLSVDETVPALSFYDSLRYSTALGLALRAVN